MSPRAKFIGLGAIVALVMIILALMMWVFKPAPFPGPEKDVITIAKAIYANQSGFDKLPFEQRITYMEKLHKERSKISAAQQSQKLTKPEYWRAKNMIFFGKHISSIQKMPSPKDKFGYDRWRQDVGQEGLGIKYPAQPDPKVPAEVETFALERAFLRVYPQKWPADWKLRWDEYCKTVRDSRSELVHQVKQIQKEIDKKKKADKKARKAAAIEGDDGDDDDDADDAAIAPATQPLTAAPKAGANAKPDPK